MYKFHDVIRGPINAEDLVCVPDSSWVLTSGMQGPTVPQAHLYAIDRRSGANFEVFPYKATVEHDIATYGEALQPLDPKHFEPHGIDVGRDPTGHLCLYVVHHGVRESVEIFRIDATDSAVALAWLGGVELPSGCWGNDVASIDGGGFVVTSTTDISEGPEVGFAKSLAGEPTGKVVEWSPRTGWSDLPGSQMNSTNGVALAPDGSQVFIAGWVPMNLMRVSRGAASVTIDTVPTGILTDNLTWSSDGRILATGAYDTAVSEFAAEFYGDNPTCSFPTRVIAIDPNTLEVEVLVDHDGSAFGAGTVAVEVDGELWVGSMRWDGVARFTKG